MIFGFRTSTVTPQISNANTQEIDHGRLIDVSLRKLSHLQSLGKNRTERQLIFVLDVLQQALYMKAQKDYGESKQPIISILMI